MSAASAASAAPAAAAAVSLPAWIHGALGAVDAPDPFAAAFGADHTRNFALTSDAYLLPALRVARSLAACVRRAEEGGDGGVPPPGSDWAASAVVHVVSRGESQQPAYLFVEGARFSPASCLGSGDGVMDVRQRIHALGLVFYEIFSGGEKPPHPAAGGSGDIHINNTHRQDGNRAEEHLGGIIDDPFQHGIDLGGALHIDPVDRLVNEVLGESTNGTAGGDTQRQSLTAQPATTGTISTEPLRARGLPQNLCTLLGDMLDGAPHGDLANDASYTHLSDVLTDLDLLLDRPDRFLRDLDVDARTVEGVRLHERGFGREAELAALQESYGRAVTGGSEIAIIAGMSGTGKSVLARRLGSTIAARGGIVIEGKFDRLQQSTPFSAIAVAFNDYCGEVIWKAPPLARALASNLLATLGGEAYHLARLIPNLGAILGNAKEGGSGQDQDCVNPLKRFLHLLCQFVEVLSRSSGATVTLFLDDCHWADPSSIEVIKHLLLVSGSMSQSRFFFVGCCREEEVHEEHPFCSMLSNVRCFGVKDTWVNLAGLEEATVNIIISDLLQLFPRLTRPLSNIIFHKTGGIPLFFSRLLVKLSKDGLLRLSFSRRRWEWDEKQIQSLQLPDDVASFYVKTINGLPSNAQLALRTLSCFGARTAVSLIARLEQKLGTPLLAPLEKAVQEGLVERRDNSYCWAHDRIQEAVYNMVGPIEAPTEHFKFGLALVSGNPDDMDDDTLFAALGQVNSGGPEVVENVQQSLLIANLNLVVGNKAMSKSDFRLAFSFFDHGIDFLRKRHWKEHYTLSLELFDCAAKSAFAISDFESLRLVTDQVLTFAQSFEATLNVLYITVSALTYSFRLPESIEKGIAVLSQLGEQLPQPVPSSDVKSCVAQTQLALSNVTDEQWLSYKKCTAPGVEWAMKFCWKLQIATTQARPNLQPIIILKMINLTLCHGVSSVSPVGFAYFGMLLGRLGNIADGYRYVKLARRLLATVESQEVAGEVILVGTGIADFVEPLQAAIESHDQGYSASMATGDVNNAMFNLGFRNTALFWSGAKLELVREDFVNLRRKIEQNKHLMALLTTCVPLQRSVLTLMGTTEADINAMTAIEGEATLLERNPRARRIRHFQRTFLSFIFRQYDQMKGEAEEYFAASDVVSWSLTYTIAAQNFIGGLVSFWVYRQTNEETWAERGHRAKLDLEKWSESSPWNFEGKKYLLEAEEYLSHNDIESARVSYDKAIACSKEHRFIHDEALANELAGYCFLQQGQKDVCLRYFMKAHEQYHEWGASAKSNALFIFVQSTLGSPST